MSGEPKSGDLWQLEARSLTRSLSESTPPVEDNADAKSAEEMVGQTLFNRFRIVSYLDGGALARVFRGIEFSIGRPVAIKVLRKQEGLRFQIAKKRLIREAEFLQSLSHPNAVEVLGYGTTEEGDAVMVMELLEGHTLRAHLDVEPVLPLSRVAAIGIQLGSALGAAHDNRGVHRDLKPANVFLERDANDRDLVKVLDFGLVTASKNQGESLTMDGFIMGTPVYMSPEQAMGENVDGRSDIYSFGVLLYEMVAGEPPFRGENVAEILTSHIDRKPVPIMERNPRADCPPALEALIQECLAKDPNDRPQHMGEVTRKLVTLARGPESVIPQFEEAISTDLVLPELPPDDHTSGPKMLPPPTIPPGQMTLGGYDQAPESRDLPQTSTPLRQVPDRNPSVIQHASRRKLYLAGIVMLLGALGLILWASLGL